MRVFLSAGEPSGDLHGANLAEALRQRIPGVELVGFGGDRMAAAEVQLLYPLTRLAVMWLGRVLANFGSFLHLGAQAESYFRTQRPDALVLIDYPGFHWHLAQRAHRYGVPVYYFVPPQLWAWAGWRVKKVRKYFRAVLTALPFEEEWYRSRGVRTHYVGHPYFDEIAAQKPDPEFVAQLKQSGQPVVALLPGSRTQEVTANFPIMLRAAQRIAAAVPNVRFAVAAYKEKQAALCGEILGGATLPLDIHVGRTPEIISACTCCIAVSGSVGLELMVRGKPTVISYKIGYAFRKIAEQLKTCKYISLVNLLADKELYPEFGVSDDRSADIAQHVIRWLQHPAELTATVKELHELNARVAKPGAVERAAEFLIRDLASLSPSSRRLA
jgi:lipid-A-disaccharide synthase